MRHSLAAIVILLSLGTVFADSVDYLKQVKPLLLSRCSSCHGALAQKGKLRLDTAALIKKGGRHGPAIVPGKSDKSLLIDAVLGKDRRRMPPEKEGAALTAEQIALLKSWIDQGAQAPSNEPIPEDPLKHWAFCKPIRPTIPTCAQPLANPIDRFIVARLKKHGLKARPIADKATLLRRVTIDLTGLPPTREQLQAFLADTSPDAYAKVVDRLLSSPQYGERWARHWMDIWRYSDWYGRRHVPDVWNSAPQIWRWRDWIVRSLNNDHGYDRMVREMLAADEICPEDYDATVATGYLIRNWYALNPNDWMRSNVEHTGKAFLGLTFNCAHCHDHKYDPITQKDYFRFRAFFEPIYIRQDRAPGETDPGPFQDYDYGKLRKIQRLGTVQVFDKAPKAPTWFYTGGDERNRVKEQGSIPPGAPDFLADWLPEIKQIDLPPRAWYPGLRPGIQETVLSQAQRAVTQARAELAAVPKPTNELSPKIRDQIAKAEAAVKQAEKTAQSIALVGRQSLLMDATKGRRIIQNNLRNLKELPDGSTLEFQLMLLADAHFNFQLAKDTVKGLTAGFVAFEKGRIISYKPGSYSEFTVGQYKVASGQNRFQVHLVLQTKADRCLLTIRSLKDDKLLVDSVPVALNGWNPIGDAKKAITFDARTGSTAVVDAVRVSAPGSRDRPTVTFNFEPPLYPNGRDVIGIDGWMASSFNVSPATSQVSSSLPSPSLLAARRKLEAAQLAAQGPTLRRRTAEATLQACLAEVASIEARIAADGGRYVECSADAQELIRKASQSEREAALKKAEADVLKKELALFVAKTKSAKLQKELTVAKTALVKAQSALADKKRALSYAPFSAMYPKTSTGRRKALAEWITHRDNPLTARVAVNHMWMRHFNVPLVASVYDFGRNGSKPTHPELLDWLAVELMESGWSMKHLHRLMVTSTAYQRVTSVGNATSNVKNVAHDPENKLLWRMHTGRMEAEVVRDSLLHLAGKLDPKMGGQELENSQALTTFRRSLYYSVHPEDGGKSPLGELFDAPDALECYRRTKSIVPQQALALTNSDLIHKMSTVLAEKLWKSMNANEGFVTAAFEQILSRPPSRKELATCLEFLKAHGPLTRQPNQAAGQARARESLVRALFNHNDFITIR